MDLHPDFSAWFGSLGLTADDFLEPGVVVQLGREPLRIDLLTSLTGVSFEDAWERRVSLDLGGVGDVPCISAEDLRTNKLALGRPEDIADVLRLPPA